MKFIVLEERSGSKHVTAFYGALSAIDAAAILAHELSIKPGRIEFYVVEAHDEYDALERLRDHAPTWGSFEVFR